MAEQLRRRTASAGGAGGPRAEDPWSSEAMIQAEIEQPLWRRVEGEGWRVAGCFSRCPLTRFDARNGPGLGSGMSKGGGPQ